MQFNYLKIKWERKISSYNENDQKEKRAGGQGGKITGQDSGVGWLLQMYNS